MLYIVGTPIGNLDDVSFRQAKTIAESDIILSEDTRSAQTLIQGIKVRFPKFDFASGQRIVSYYQEKEFEKLPEILDLLEKDKTISLISESGMPLIYDPGYLLVKACIKKNIPFTVIPGPSAVTVSLIYSGFNPNEFMFLGFLPKKESEISKIFTKLESIKKIFPEMIFVFYESARRINGTLGILSQSSWIREVVIGRELTKKFEEIMHGKPENLLKMEFKGETTLLVI